MSNDPAFEQRLKHWRHAFHRHPETGFEEFDTAEQVASILASFGSWRCTEASVALAWLPASLSVTARA